MTRFLVYIVVLLFVVSCNDGVTKPKKPDNLIPKSTMVDIIVDINLMNAAKGVNKRLLEEKVVNPEAYIYKKYNIDSLQFSKSSDYYAYDIKTYEAIYQQAKERLEAKKMAWEADEKARREEADSLRQAKRREKKPTRTRGNIPKDSVSIGRSRSTETLPQ